MSKVRSMTSEKLVERLRAEAAVFVGNALQAACGFDAEMDDVTGQLLDEAASELSRLHEALAAAETEREWLAKLQSALAFWMPGVTEAIEIELNGRAGDDAYLLAGFDGEVPVPSWGDKAISRAEAAEAKLASLPALLAETRKKALEEAAAHLMQISDAMWERCETQRPTEPWARPPSAEKEDAVTAWFFQKAADAIRSLSAEEAQP